MGTLLRMVQAVPLWALTGLSYRPTYPTCELRLPSEDPRGKNWQAGATLSVSLLIHTAPHY